MGSFSRKEILNFIFGDHLTCLFSIVGGQHYASKHEWHPFGILGKCIEGHDWTSLYLAMPYAFPVVSFYLGTLGRGLKGHSWISPCPVMLCVILVMHALGILMNFRSMTTLLTYMPSKIKRINLVLFHWVKTKLRFS